jgi:hypothetical protein
MLAVILVQSAFRNLIVYTVMKQNHRAAGCSGNFSGPVRILGGTPFILTDFSRFFYGLSGYYPKGTLSSICYPTIQLNSFPSRPPYPHYLLEVRLCEGLIRPEWSGEEKYLP